jgi:hypothetical protein
LPVKNDVLGNVNKVKAKYESSPSDFPFLQDIVLADLKENNNQMGLASEGLLWLKR